MCSILGVVRLGKCLRSMLRWLELAGTGWPMIIMDMARGIAGTYHWHGVWSLYEVHGCLY